MSCRYRFLDGNGRGNGAENNPDAQKRQSHQILQRIKRVGSSGSTQKTLVGHKINHALGDESGHAPAQRPDHYAEQIEQIITSDVLQRWKRQHPDENGRQGVADEQNRAL